MRSTVWLLAAAAMALAAPATQRGPRVSLVFPPLTLPPGTVLVLEDAKGMALWEGGKGVAPGAEALGKAAYVVFKLPKAAYRYPVVRRGDKLEAFVVKVGKRVYSLGVLLKNRHVALGKDGSLVFLKAAHPAPAASKKP
ncbi:hypothetical protein TthAA37_22320 (plasmid) [Thermus thermophilus]|uniref:Uncharacterized protein n=1 Tax=Thermus thermophilus TaxID=274 RepID=A0AAD1NZV9_THETH|nr:hypothetical protein [Thermus thermophilus]BBL83325.1 hypothetical protein TthAA220_21090 [Thermus thermophilus]BBL85598.1 hypothetical protein TthAA229_20790 [Thermus thermophilus]BCZ88057.1 hypothetical protein TthAA11_22390 [Thermus thermophilus]BCZ90327.1 hypothetical protein TthAA22_21320 [Thermus thermophilus]BCZ93043.1 hypothetical protein TthAA37_22320 [Thermus thermophilus]